MSDWVVALGLLCTFVLALLFWVSKNKRFIWVALLWAMYTFFEYAVLKEWIKVGNWTVLITMILAIVSAYICIGVATDALKRKHDSKNPIQ